MHSDVENGELDSDTKALLLEEFYQLSEKIRVSEPDVVRELIEERRREADSK